MMTATNAARSPPTDGADRSPVGPQVGSGVGEVVGFGEVTLGQGAGPVPGIGPAVLGSPIISQILVLGSGNAYVGISGW